MASSKKIFISYSRANLGYVTQLVKVLRNKGIEVWFDQHIEGGDVWDNELEHQLKNADVIIWVLSKASVASENVANEISYAESLNKKVIPIKIENCDMRMRWARKQYINFIGSHSEEGLKQLIHDIDKEDSPGEKPPKPPYKPYQPVKKSSGTPVLKILLITGGAISLIFVFFIIVFAALGSMDSPVDPGPVDPVQYDQSGFTNTDPVDYDDTDYSNADTPAVTPAGTKEPVQSNYTDPVANPVASYTPTDREKLYGYVYSGTYADQINLGWVLYAQLYYGNISTAFFNTDYNTVPAIGTYVTSTQNTSVYNAVPTPYQAATVLSNMPASKVGVVVNFYITDTEMWLYLAYAR